MQKGVRRDSLSFLDCAINTEDRSLNTEMYKQPTQPCCHQAKVYATIPPDYGAASFRRLWDSFINPVQLTLHQISAQKTASVTGRCLLGKKNHCNGQTPSPLRESDSVQFADRDYVIMSFRVKHVTLSLSRMFGGSGSQSQHIIAASI